MGRELIGWFGSVVARKKRRDANMNRKPPPGGLILSRHACPRMYGVHYCCFALVHLDTCADGSSFSSFRCARIVGTFRCRVLCRFPFGENVKLYSSSSHDDLPGNNDTCSTCLPFTRRCTVCRNSAIRPQFSRRHIPLIFGTGTQEHSLK